MLGIRVIEVIYATKVIIDIQYFNVENPNKGNIIGKTRKQKKKKS